MRIIEVIRSNEKKIQNSRQEMHILAVVELHMITLHIYLKAEAYQLVSRMKKESESVQKIDIYIYIYICAHTIKML